MCGFAAILRRENIDEPYISKVRSLLHHRGPDDHDVYRHDELTLVHTRLSILELGKAGHQPMLSENGRYVIAYNGEIYNHLDLRRKYLSDHHFRGHSDTETLVELFDRLGEKMLPELVGMWSMAIWDTMSKKLFLSRDRFGQKPLYYRNNGDDWFFSSEIKPLLLDKNSFEPEPTAIVDFIAHGNYGHLNDRTFFKEIRQFPQAGYTWMEHGQSELTVYKYWDLPDINQKDKEPFDAVMKKELHDIVVEAVLSQTLSDVPIGATLSGGMDSAIITGILASYRNDKINVFTAQVLNTSYDESRYVNAVIDKYPGKLIVHRKNLEELSIRDEVEKYISIQEEPFGDPSIIAHGYLMKMAADSGIKVILGGQGADELFFGYDNMLTAILLKQFRNLHFRTFSNNIRNLRYDRQYVLRIFLKAIYPELERKMRIRSRMRRENAMVPGLRTTDDSLYQLPNYKDSHSVWKESIYSIHLPHLVHYDDRNGMAYGIEGRMPFLDHRIIECLSKVNIESFFKNGLRKYPLREACKEYMPDIIQNRRDKIGFHTPLINAIYNDKGWIVDNIKDLPWTSDKIVNRLIQKISNSDLNIVDALYIWKFLVCRVWQRKFNIE